MKYAELNNAKYIIYLSNNTLKLFDSLVVEVEECLLLIQYLLTNWALLVFCIPDDTNLRRLGQLKGLVFS